MKNALASGSFVRMAGLAAIVCFFLPWGTVSCGGERLGTFDGWDLATGIDNSAFEAPGQELEDTQEPQVFFVLVGASVTLLISGLIAARLIDALIGNAIIAVMAVVNLIVLFTTWRALDADASQAGARLDLRYGAFGTAVALAVILVAAGFDVGSRWSARRRLR